MKGNHTGKNLSHATKTESYKPKPKPIQNIFATETRNETESYKPKPKPIENIFAETGFCNRKPLNTVNLRKNFSQEGGS